MFVNKLASNVCDVKRRCIAFDDYQLAGALVQGRVYHHGLSSAVGSGGDAGGKVERVQSWCWATAKTDESGTRSPVTLSCIKDLVIRCDVDGRQ